MFGLCDSGCQSCAEQRVITENGVERPVQLADTPLVIVESVRAVNNRVADKWNELEGASRSPAAVEALSPRLKPFTEKYDGCWPPPTVLMCPPPSNLATNLADSNAASEPSPTNSKTNNKASNAAPASNALNNNAAPKKELPEHAKTCCGSCIYSPTHKMEEQEVLSKGCFCLYCCCLGCGFTNWIAQLRLVCKCCICRHTSETAKCCGVHDGCCTQTQTCCCCMSICHLPPTKGSPCCILCNERFCGLIKRCGQDPGDHHVDPHHCTADDGQDGKTGVLEHFLDETSVICYSCCTGCAVAPCSSCYHGRFKCCCCKCKVQTAYPIEHHGGDHDGCCSFLLTCWWCLALCRFPPRFNIQNPIIECCGCKLRSLTRPAHHVGPHDNSTQTKKHQPIDAPAQETMD